jgi:hypothetical protein
MPLVLPCTTERPFTVPASRGVNNQHPNQPDCHADDSMRVREFCANHLDGAARNAGSRLRQCQQHPLPWGLRACVISYVLTHYSLPVAWVQFNCAGGQGRSAEFDGSGPNLHKAQTCLRSRSSTTELGLLFIIVLVCASCALGLLGSAGAKNVLG